MLIVVMLKVEAPWVMVFFSILSFLSWIDDPSQNDSKMTHSVALNGWHSNDFLRHSYDHS